MADNSTLIAVSAFSGLAGALLTQVITAVNAYYVERRRQAQDLRNEFRSKKVEIGENFYFVQGEIMAVVQKNIAYWKNWHSGRSEASLDALNREVAKFTAYTDKLYQENWKYNLIGIYFPVTFTTADIEQSNALSQRYHLSILDLTTKIKAAEPGEADALYERYAVVVFDMCAHYERLYEQMAHDRDRVRGALLDEFKINR